jgi:hypothetical protein
MTDFAQASRRGGRGGEAFNIVVVVKQGEVEKRIEQESNNLDMQAMGQFLIESGC